MEILQDGFYVDTPRFCFLAARFPFSGLLALAHLSSHLAMS